jgi:hypothetical protein
VLELGRRKKHEGIELYLMLDNEEDKGVALYEQFTDDPHQETIWICVIDAIAYTIWQAYQYENQKYLPQPIETVDNDTIGEFMSNIRKINGYDENWASVLREYLLTHYSPASSDKKIKRSEIMSQI